MHFFGKLNLIALIGGDTTTPTVASASENTEMDSFQSHEQVFPTEVLENIFCRLGLVDLYTSTRRVCRHWNEIITAEVTLKKPTLCNPNADPQVCIIMYIVSNIP